ncbi:Hypothetical protein NGAL_HAMBI1145_09660 [Neorhizobium galegae bv. officinalis]|uniref:Uncharacterized protein n=1 Tax=Neorhizobium galegae bv. officinalis TaxID=323656 RepID=A0A0T7FAY1_NEOGA|nr:Hypothetical protein NGAL_HAMBI1145_09660 [Neorhizobium galegae bv. officinalis]
MLRNLANLVVIVAISYAIANGLMAIALLGGR